jgi:hypothetical protein
VYNLEHYVEMDEQMIIKVIPSKLDEQQVPGALNHKQLFNKKVKKKSTRSNYTSSS